MPTPKKNNIIMPPPAENNKPSSVKSVKINTPASSSKVFVNPSTLAGKSQRNTMGGASTTNSQSIPTNKVPDQVDFFDSFIDEELSNNQVEEGLTEIYQGDDGKMVNVQKMDIKKGHGIIYKILVLVISLLAIAGIGKAAYNYYGMRQAQKSENIVFAINGDIELISGKEFYYTVNYKNLQAVDLKNITINLTYPANFIFEDSSLPPSQNNNSWKIDYLASKRGDEIRIKGKLVGEVDQSNIILGSMNYTSVNFSSEFTKEASFNNKITDLGLEINTDSPSSVLIGDEADISVKYKLKAESYLNNFRVTMEPADNIQFSKRTEKDAQAGVWLVTDASSSENSLDIKFNFKDKTTDNQKVVLDFEYSADGQKYYPFLRKEIAFDVMSKNLNLNLIINGSSKDQGVDFGQTLNYSIVYANKGQGSMKDIVIMATLEGDQLDWTSLIDKNNGSINGNKITWNKDQIHELANLSPDNRGSIDFSIKLNPASQVDPTKTYEVRSYVRFSVGTNNATSNTPTTASSTTATSTSNQATSTPAIVDSSKSNEIVNKINSDLTLKEQVRYFNDDNIAVGSGPLPPKVGETTSYKIYWNLSNSLNELNNLIIETTLPANVNWENKNLTDLGAIQYNTSTRKVTWNIGRLPITVYKAQAEFNVSVTPTIDDQNKILVLIPGTKISATDVATQAQLNKTTPAKTTKLVDDTAVSDDGRVQQ